MARRNPTSDTAGIAAIDSSGLDTRYLTAQPAG
jgi:hypothetical protein